MNEEDKLEQAKRTQQMFECACAQNVGSPTKDPIIMFFQIRMKEAPFSEKRFKYQDVFALRVVRLEAAIFCPQ